MELQRRWDYKEAKAKVAAASEKKRLFQYQYDHKGLRIPSSKQPFSLFSTPEEIGIESESLGAYFQTVQFMILQLFFYAILASWTLSVHLQTGNKFSKEYELRIFSSDGTTLLQSVDCSKYWPVSSVYSRISLGTFCQPNSRNSNPINCPAQCDYITPKLLSAIPDASTCLRDPAGYFLAGLQPSLSLETAAFYTALQVSGKLDPASDEYLCFKHLPCAGSFDHGKDASDGSCECCKLRLVTQGPKAGVTEGIFELWQFYVLMVLFFVTQLILRVRQKRLGRTLDERKLTASDFTIVVSNLPRARGDAEIERLRVELTNYCRHFGDVCYVAPMLNIKEILVSARRLDQLRKMKLELEARQVYGSERGFFGPLYFMIFGGGSNLRDAMDVNEHETAAEVAKLKQLERNLERKCIGSAIVTFESQTAAENFCADHRLSGVFARLITSMPWLGPLLNDRCCAFVPTFRFFRPESGCLPNKRYLLAPERASEPSDVIFEANTSYGFRRWLQNSGSDLAGLVCIVLSAAAQFGLEAIKRRVRDQSTGLLVVYDNKQTSLTSSHLSVNQVSKIVSSNQILIQTEAVAVLCSFIVVIINLFLQVALRATIRLEQKGTKTNQQMSLLWKLSCAFVINSFVIPVSSSLLTNTSRKAWYSVGGLSTEAVSIQVSNAIIPPLLSLINPVWLMRRLIFPKYARTVEMLERLTDPEEFIIAERLANHVKTVALGILFSPVTPLSPMIALGAEVISYLTDMYIIIHVAHRPPEMRVESVATVHMPLAIIQIASQLFVGLVFFSHRKRQAVQYLWVSCCTWGAMYLLPWGRVIAWCAQSPGKVAPSEAAQTPFHHALNKGETQMDTYTPSLPHIGLSDELRFRLRQMYDITTVQPANPHPLRGQKSSAVSLLASGAIVLPPAVNGTPKSLSPAPSQLPLKGSGGRGSSPVKGAAPMRVESTDAFKLQQQQQQQRLIAPGPPVVASTTTENMRVSAAAARVAPSHPSVSGGQGPAANGLPPSYPRPNNSGGSPVPSAPPAPQGPGNGAAPAGSYGGMGGRHGSGPAVPYPAVVHGNGPMPARGGSNAGTATATAAGLYGAAQYPNPNHNGQGSVGTASGRSSQSGLGPGGSRTMPVPGSAGGAGQRRPPGSGGARVPSANAGGRGGVANGGGYYNTVR